MKTTLASSKCVDNGRGSLQKQAVVDSISRNGKNTRIRIEIIRGIVSAKMKKNALERELQSKKVYIINKICDRCRM